MRVGDQNNYTNRKYHKKYAPEYRYTTNEKRLKKNIVFALARGEATY